MTARFRSGVAGAPSRVLRRAACVMVLCMGTSAFAGMFSVSPVRLFMQPRERAIAVTVTNESDEELVMQADVYLWKQKDGGEDELVLTEDMILNPPILKLAPRAKQTGESRRPGHPRRRSAACRVARYVDVPD